MDASLLRKRPFPDLVQCAESLSASELSHTHKREMEGIRGICEEECKKASRQGQMDPFQRPAKKGSKCEYCGYSSHSRLECPACSAKCNSCRKVGHYAVVCGSRSGTKGKIREIAQEEQRSSEEFLRTLTAVTKNYWKAVVQVNHQKCEFKLDTGAEVAILAQDEPAL